MDKSYKTIREAVKVVERLEDVLERASINADKSKDVKTAELKYDTKLKSIKEAIKRIETRLNKL